MRTGTRRARRRLMATAIATGTPALAALSVGQASADGTAVQVQVPGLDPVTVDVPALPGVTVPTVTGPVVSVGPTTPPAPPSSGSPQPAPSSSGGGSAPSSSGSPGGGDRVPGPAPVVRRTVEAGRRADRELRRIRRRVVRPARPGFRPDGVPTHDNPGYTFALPGPAPIGVPDFFIDKFRIPPFLLPIYQAAGVQYGVRWELLAAINEIETDYGRNLNVSSAGALGWMQFMPATWKAYGVDANADGRRDPYNPVDAIFAAARYLKASGVATDVRKAVFAYNHANWYVDSVLMRARLIGGTPADLIGSLTGLTQGRFPVAAPARYAAGTRATNVFARPGAAVVAVQDGTVTQIGRSRKLGRFVRLRDAFGNTYTYARLGRVARTFEVAARRTQDGSATREPAARPVADLTAGVDQVAARLASVGVELPAAPLRAAAATGAVAGPVPVKQRLFAHPDRHTDVVQRTAGGGEVRRLRVGSRVAGGTVLGRLAETVPGMASHVRFAIRPAGKGAPAIDPKPILDGWKLLESTAIYRARGRNPLFGPDARNPSVGQVLLMSKAQLVRRVLGDPRIVIYPGGRGDIRSGQIDRRVLASLAMLSASGLKPTVSSLKGNHSRYTSSGNVSAHSTGNAVDISAINGVPILGHQGAGSITDIAVRRLLTLQGAVKPNQIITLMAYPGADNTIALPDHHDHIHVGFPAAGSDAAMVLGAPQWTRLIERLGRIDNPTLRELGR